MQYQSIPMGIYQDILCRRFVEAQSWWGTKKTEALWGQFLYLVEKHGIAPNDSDPHTVVDNYVVNSEIVSREDYENNRYPIRLFGCESFEDLCEKSIIHNNEYAMINISLNFLKPIKKPE